ncbi:hypothetical protein GETHLI_14230 [Geothrix limicola]|uniref:PKD domain-containing protein n=1 Tax=Geothrix limicola TaxID=2927978 RepID=A0ABQ5QES5_9BACT|nr:M4 family metallopeptidase [Geothrix limicola]GLH72921.1 hypothetical protein GETHLI_14230 [Geothrix limicola]
MATFKGRMALSFVTAALAAGSLLANAPQESLQGRAAADHLLSQRSQLGLDANHDFRLRRTHTDELGQTHAHFQQTYKGVRVWGGDAISHVDHQGRHLPLTHSLSRHINLNVTPAMSSDEALAVVHQDLAPAGSYAYEPTVELVIVPETVNVVRNGIRAEQANAVDVTAQVLRHTLAYHIHTQLENGTAETAHTDYLINAHTGAILSKWSTLHTSAVVGTANTQYSGTVQINTNSTATGFELRDMTRGTGGTFGNNVVTNLNHATSGTGTIYTDADNTWGDGANYISGGSTTSANGQTAAVDAHYGIMATWDMFKKVLGRNGIDNTGKASYLRVHYSSSYDNAFWDDTCFCMTFGDGSSFKSLESVDVAGHEMSHGVCATAVPGGLTYSGESGGLNESNSDIFGTMVEFYDLGGGLASGATTIPSTGGNWTIGEQLETSSFPTPLRYMYKPSKDGSSPDAWSSTIGNLDVHYSSGPGNREFYFLSQGASNVSSSDYYSSYTPAGFAGVGNDHAARIHYRALTTYYTSSTTYAQARTAHINAAKDLYGAGSPEEQAVWNSFAAINVGSAWTGSTALAAAITTPSGNVTIASGTSQSFVGAASGGTSPYTYSWTFGDGGTASTASASHTYTNTGSTAVTYTATFTVTDSASHTASATRTITVNPAAGVAVAISPTTVSLNTGATQQFTASVTGSTNTAVTWSVVEAGGGSVSTSGLYTAPTTAGTYHVKATSQADTTKSATATVTVSAPGTTTELITNGGFESGVTGWSGNTGDINTWSGQPAHSGTKNAWLQGNGSTSSENLSQSIAIPSTATSATLTFWLHIDTAETTTTTAYDTMKVQVISGTTTTTLATYSNLNKATGYAQKTFDLSAYKGKTVTLKFLGSEDSSLQTSFVLDDVSVKVQ